MLGPILRSLTDASRAEEALRELADEPMLARVRAAADASSIPVGMFAARAVRHVLDHGGDDVWLELLGAMARTPHPGTAALAVILAKALPEHAHGCCAGAHP